MLPFVVMLNRFFAATIAIGVAALLSTAFSRQTFASSTNVVGSAPNQEAVSKFVNDALHVWQERMNLKDWKIRVELVRADKLEPRTLGNVHWDTDTKSATIGVLSPLDYQLPYNAMLADMEVTVVHELVHIELASLPRSEASRGTEEHAVNEISAALLNLAHH